MNSKQRKVLLNLFEEPAKRTIKWSDIKNLVIAANGNIKYRDGSRIRILLGERSLNIHTPHPQKELKPYQVRAVRKLFEKRGILP